MATSHPRLPQRAKETPINHTLVDLGRSTSVLALELGEGLSDSANGWASPWPIDRIGAPYKALVALHNTDKAAVLAGG